MHIQKRLGRSVERPVGNRKRREDRGDIQDPAAPRGKHRGKRGPQQRHGSMHVRYDHGPEHLRIDRCGGTYVAGRCVIDQDLGRVGCQRGRKAPGRFHGTEIHRERDHFGGCARGSPDPHRREAEPVGIAGNQPEPPGAGREAQGDLHIDGHHTVEDIGITLGMAVARALADKTGIRRYGHAYVPLDEALSRVVVDFSGRPGLHMDVQFTAGMIGQLDTQLVFEFFQGFVNHAGVTLHIDNLKGFNAHHQCETIFKAFARALRAALERDPRLGDVIPSTKGSL